MAAGALQRSALTGDVTASAGSNTTTIANDAVTYAKMQDVSATSRALGRKTAGAGDPEELTLSELLDFIGSAAQGDILYRGASAWARLPAGTDGQYLKTRGAGANPEWATVTPGGFTLLGTITTTSGQSQSLGSLNLTSYKFLKLVFNGVSHSSIDRQGLLIGQSTSDDVLFTNESDINSTDTINGHLEIELATGIISSATLSSITEFFITTPIVNASTSVSIALNQNNGPASFDAGSVRVYGGT
jgi:hypothetical protein